MTYGVCRISSKALSMVIIVNSQTKGNTLSGADRIFKVCEALE